MKITDVRFGNTIYSKGQSHNENNEFLGWVNYEIKVDLEVLQNIYINNEDFKYSAIPLSAEHLLRLGFEYDAGKQFLVKFLIEDDNPEELSQFIRIDATNIDFIESGEIVDLLNGIEESIFLQEKFQYVHQLQNLFHSLTGKEIFLNKTI